MSVTASSISSSRRGSGLGSVRQGSSRIADVNRNRRAIGRIELFGQQPDRVGRGLLGLGRREGRSDAGQAETAADPNQRTGQLGRQPWLRRARGQSERREQL